MQIVHFPHPSLGFMSRPITSINESLKRTVREMFELMYEAKGVGLAANQVALPFRFFIMNISGDADLADEEHVFFNPELSGQAGSVECEEGCLSVPELYGQVKRFERITIEAYDLNGQGFAMDLDELPSRVVQHETDHLDGVMFFDRMNDLDRQAIEPQIDEFVTVFRHGQSTGEIPADASLTGQLEILARDGLGR
jgi:peptide deformylase